MIEFKIITCPDKSQQATYQHVGRELLLGKTDGEMIIDDPGIGPVQLKIVVESDRSATLENLNTSIEVRLNGKAIAGVTPLKEKDNVTVARTTINFSRLDLTSLPVPETFVHPNEKERFTIGSKEKAILDVLDHLEKNPGQPPIPDGSGARPPPPLPGGAKPPLPPGRAASPPPPLPKKT
ncbi:MAG: hypothetical protein ACXVB9_22530 [Bdellovibrionota bacterium]